MSLAPLVRRAPAPPVRLVHLGAGAFFRAHQAWCTDLAPDADAWGYAAFGGRGGARAERLAAQDGLFTVAVRSPHGDEVRVVRSVAEVHAAADHDAWLDRFRSPALAAVTITVTEAGYQADPAEIDDLRRSPTAPVRSAPARLVAGLLARRHADLGPIALIPCDNLPANGAVLGRVMAHVAERVGGDAAAAVAEGASTVSTVVDRITPAITPEQADSLRAATGLADALPVVTEPFWEWALCGALPAGGPDWAAVGATVTDAIEPYEQRKLTLLNGAHSLLAYLGSIRGHRTVADAVADPDCRAWVEAWWDEAGPHIDQPTSSLVGYRAALAERLGNHRMHHQLGQIASDGSLKIPVRVLPTVRAERATGRPARAGTVILGAWLAHLRGIGAPVTDVQAARLSALARRPLEEAVRGVLAHLDPALADDGELVAATLAATRDLERVGR